MVNKLIIESDDNDDWNGRWFKDEVQREMSDLGVNPVKNDWIAWILDHMFTTEEFSPEIESLIEKCDALSTMTLHLKDGEVTIIKL